MARTLRAHTAAHSSASHARSKKRGQEAMRSQVGFACNRAEVLQGTIAVTKLHILHRSHIADICRFLKNLKGACICAAQHNEKGPCNFLGKPICPTMRVESCLGNK